MFRDLVDLNRGDAIYVSDATQTFAYRVVAVETTVDLVGDQREIALAFNNLGWLLNVRREFDAARRHHEAGLEIRRRIKNVPNPQGRVDCHG